eukprot:CAMPEP_0185795462 /NCGR_PEP_ID=MMETSP1174-20130828/160560_1 /TAXON_ID=35687 /ORGANISM="Dictyocha speculum, Strain CCMP1381" /LENGTH=64 /DNA_ID=CAMNT_0028490753 /DNA_START=584 /DNA_END=774 /DNA_ORIENTATION=-
MFLVKDMFVDLHASEPVWSFDEKARICPLFESGFDATKTFPVIWLLLPPWTMIALDSERTTKFP